MIMTTVHRHEAEEKRLAYRSCGETLANVIAEGTSCSRFEAAVIAEKAAEVFGVGPYGVDGTMLPGQMKWRAIDASEPPGKPLKSCVYRDIVLTVHDLAADREVLSLHGRSAKRQQQIVRMVGEAMEQGTLLTQEDLAVLLDCDVRTVREDIRGYQKRHDVLVPTRGTRLDIGPGVTHREKIIELHLRGRTEAEAARDMNHSVKAASRYIAAFCRIVHCMEETRDSLKTAHIVGVSYATVTRHMELYARYARNPSYRDRLEEIRKLGARYWECVDGKKKHGRTGGSPL